ncbi:LuxR C-terminal-related transcriptional regulator [Actinoplanes sp. ATCC 53533]|uniref:ATP-binding protein n=1 Tax=Actinoplanes sp. ATCC 53533 TaxID=1288362 RepID=UPI000F783B46|nr:LuxR C-terminal-related transcriptional regulator [Actinoplanes sp. ATCC 53533]
MSAGTRGGLPAELTSFVGRRLERGELKGLLGASRLVTLTGVGGVGKTRLASRVAAEARRAFGGGVWFVDLTQLEDPGLLAREFQDPDALAYLVLAALGVGQRAGSAVRQLADHLADRQALLILDNCEHLLPACAVLVDATLRACPRLRVLTTSREPLAIAGEVIYPVPPLPTPGPDRRPEVASLAGSESVVLFVARAKAVSPEFALTGEHVDAVVELCRRLDGLPLGIELAAARVRVLSPQQILDRMDDRFALLSRGSRAAPARQRSLRACVEWSFDLSSKPERLLWARLSVFVGTFELDAVEGVCTGERLPAADLMEVLTGLIDKSIVDRVDSRDGGDTQARYRMLEVIRDYGREQLIESGEQVALRERHRDWYQGLAARAATERISRRQTYWIARFTREHPNVRVAVESYLGEPGHGDSALRLVTGLPWAYWWSGGLCGEGLGWLKRALARTTEPTVLRVRALLLAGFLAGWLDDARGTMSWLAEGERLAERLRDAPGLALAAFVHGSAVLRQCDDLSGVVESAERGLAIVSALPERERQQELTLRMQLLLQLGPAAALTGQYDRARRCFEEALEIADAAEASLNRTWALWGLGLVAWREGHAPAADHHVRECLRSARATGVPDPYVAALGLAVLAWIAAGQRQHRRAATLLGAVDRIQSDLGRSVTRDRWLIADHNECEERVRTALGDAACTDDFRHGRALPLDDALGYALDGRRPTSTPPGGGAAPLTRREREVAGLIVRGLSNREIATSLVIAQRTAESHVEHILTKLGFTNRAQIAAWTAEQHPASPPG